MRVKRKKKKKIKYHVILILLFSLLILLLSSYFLIRIDIPKEIKIDVNQKFDREVKANFLFVDLTDKLVVDGSIDTSTIGEYSITYKVRFMGISKKKVVNVLVVDREEPKITLTGGNDIEVYLNQEYKELGYEVSDNYDKDIEVNIKGDVDTSKDGRYYLTYTAIDSSNNKVEVVRKVTVEKISPLELSVKDFNLSEYFPDIIMKKDKDKGSEYINKIVLAGDSVPWHFGNYKIISPSKVYARPCEGPNNFFTQKVYHNNVLSNYTLPELIVKNKPEYLYLHMGICDINQDNVNKFIDNYKKALDYIEKESPDTEIVVMSLVPQTKEYLSWIPLRNNVKINKFNYYIAKMCKEEGIRFLDIAPIVKNKNGLADVNLFMDDGYHLNYKGMTKTIEIIRNYS